ncbi:MAG: hypothetical protein DLM59_09880 [Pseudonocardiales bacterium]|nr:MAG: hypothetical protein DLM59_09880 [Pseudonocardiales bacterium]
MSGGAGRDYIDGQAGDDVLRGGSGNDTVYGMSGNDQISGGDGQDYLEGATGDDSIDGGAGNDMISGGRGDDVIRAGAGNDVVYGGAGTDTVAGGSGNDTAYVQSGDQVDTEKTVTVEIRDVGNTIRVEGSPEFVERVQADLDMLRSSPRGQLMLAQMDRVHNETGAIAKDWPVLGGLAYQGDTIRIVETTDANGYASDDQGVLDQVFNHNNYKIQYDPRFQTIADGPPVTVLYHEMAHVYDFSHDTSADGSYDNPANPDQMYDSHGHLVGVPNDEREAVGLPIDPDGDGHYEIDPDHPFDYTENGLRDELGAPQRPKYGF